MTTSIPLARPAPHFRFDPKIIAVIFGAVFAWSEVSQAWRDWGLAGMIFSYTAFIPLQIASAWALFRASRRPDLPLSVQRALQLIAATFVAFALGSATLAVITIGSQDEARYTAADFFYALSYPLQAAGLLLLPRASGMPRRRSRQVLDIGALFLTSGILVYTHFELRADWSGLSQVLATLFPMLALGSLLAANAALTRGLPIPSRRAWRMLVFALAANLLSDLVFQTLWATGYQGPNWSLPVAVAVNVVMLWAADWYAHDPMAELRAPGTSVIPFSPLPILLATGGAGVLLLLVMQGNLTVVRPVLITLILLNVLLVAREFLLVVDATSAARHETAREGERRFEALVRHSTDLVLVVDAGQTVRFASPAVQALLGRAPDQVVGRPLAALIHPTDQAGAANVLEELLLAPGLTSSTAIRFLHANGDWRRFECNAANLMQEPAVRGVVLNSRDVTERTLLEEQLRQAQKMEVVGQLAGGVAHDFNNLLTTVLTGSEFALQDLPVDHVLRPDLENIRVAAQRGAALTRRLLAFSRPRGADPRVVPIGARVLGAQPLMERLVGTSYALRLSIDHQSGAAQVDPDELEHALLNLVANARDAMSGGGVIDISVARRTLDRQLESPFLPVPPGEYVVVEVADSGEGIDAVSQARLFQPFFTTKMVGHGTGLGLAGVFAFMRRSNGGISVASTPGLGARFQLWFPRVELPEVSAPRVEPDDLPSGSGHILLVEDDNVVRHAARRILESAGYTVHEAGDADAGRRLFASRAGGFDLLVTDVMMPGESGAALAAAFRRTQPELPVLYVSGYPGEELVRLGLFIGEVELLRKPFTVRELTERVRDVLAQRAGDGASSVSAGVPPARRGASTSRS